MLIFFCPFRDSVLFQILFLDVGCDEDDSNLNRRCTGDNVMLKRRRISENMEEKTESENEEQNDEFIEVNVDKLGIGHMFKRLY